MAKPVESSDTIADAVAALPHIESLKYPPQEEVASRKARSSCTPLREGDDDPDDDHRPYLPWEQGVCEGGDEG